MNTEQLAAKQQELEALCTGRGLDRYLDALEHNREQKTETKVKRSPARVALDKSIEPLTKAFDGLLKDLEVKRGPKPLAIRFLTELKAIEEDSRVAAYLTAMAVLDSLTTAPKSTSVCEKIAGYFIDELRYRHFAEHAQALYDWKIKSFNTSSYAHMKRSMDATLLYAQQPKEDGKMPPIPPVPEWLEKFDRAQRIQIGAYALDLFVAATGLVEEVMIYTSKNQRLNIVQATEETKVWIDEITGKNCKLAPVSLPMVMKPAKWSKEVRGGYLFHEGLGGLEGRFPLMRSVTGKDRTISGVEQVEMPVVYDALNAIQETPYLVNKDVLDTMMWMYEHGIKGVSGLPLADPIPLPEKPADIATNKASSKAWRLLVSPIKEENHVLVNERLTFLNTVNVAKLMLDQVDDATGQPLPFFFPHNLDFRGRTYPIPVYLQPQGHDVARGLLLFGTKKPLGSQEAVDWLCIHGANNLGKTAQGFALDKASFEERIQWVLDHSGQICAAASYPAEFRSFWAGDNVDNPWQFLAFCFEWKKFIDSGKSLSFECSLPGSMDGSCNGLQHYAALLKDEELAKSVNLIPSQVPQDIYRVVAAEVNRRLLAETKLCEIAQDWIQWGKVDRKFVKRPVMTLPYGSGRSGFRNQIKEYLKGLNEKSRPSFFKEKSLQPAMVFMAGTIFDSLATSSRSAVEAMQFFKDCARLASKSDAPIQWTAPSGLPVQQAYPAMTMQRIDTMLAGSVRCRLQYQTPSTGENGAKMLNSKKQASGIAPNIIHSLDASAMMLTVKQALSEGIDHFLMVHDSFGCHMADAPRMSHIVRETFAKMYAGSTVIDSLVADLTNNIDMSTDPELPISPAQGSLEITEVLDSKYFFA